MTTLLLIAGNLWASPYTNLREGKSRFILESEKPLLQDILDRGHTKDVFSDLLNDTELNSCASKIVFEIKDQLKIDSPQELENTLKAMRFDNQIDDVALDLLLRVIPLSDYQQNPFTSTLLNDEEENIALNIVKQHAKDMGDNSLCVEDSYRDLVFDLLNKNQKYSKYLKQIFKSAYKNEIISKGVYKTLDNLKQNKVHLWPMTLNEYKRSLQSIAKKFPDRHQEESDFVSAFTKKDSPSLRQQLYQKYSYQQIILLGNLIANLKKRLDAKDISIDIQYENQSKEIISLTPMEKFRFILKQLRRELSNINNGTLLNGKTATYTDLIVASYEIGFISSNEISQLVSLQEIWNPTRTTKEKVLYWAKTFGGTASVLLPAPYGFISVLALMYIDQQLNSTTINHDLDYLLF